MIVNIGRDLSVRLDSPEDFKKFSVQIEASAEDFSRVRDAAAAAGNLVDAETMWVDETWLRQTPACAGDAAWQEGVTGMIGYARKHGWVDEKSGAIRAHVVWSE